MMKSNDNIADYFAQILDLGMFSDAEKQIMRESKVDFNKIKMSIRENLGKYFYLKTECKPMILIIVQEI